jgi:hypothetical protein
MIGFGAPLRRTAQRRVKMIEKLMIDEMGRTIRSIVRLGAACRTTAQAIAEGIEALIAEQRGEDLAAGFTRAATGIVNLGPPARTRLEAGVAHMDQQQGRIFVAALCEVGARVTPDMSAEDAEAALTDLVEELEGRIT